jgi:hypothetical protein
MQLTYMWNRKQSIAAGTDHLVVYSMSLGEPSKIEHLNVAVNNLVFGQQFRT